MHLKIPYLHANRQDEGECEDMQNNIQFSITYISVVIINVFQHFLSSDSMSSFFL